MLPACAPRGSERTCSSVHRAAAARHPEHSSSFYAFVIDEKLLKVHTVPQTSSSATQIRQCMHGKQRMHVHFFGSEFVSIENKVMKIQLPKLKVASSSLVARSICSGILDLSSRALLV